MNGILTKRKGLSSNALKYIVVVAMLLDHIAWYFIPINSVLAQIFHFIGRLTAPVMCYFVAEGYHYTKDINKYLKRLLIFSVICHVLFVIKANYRLNGFKSIILNSETILCQTSVFWTLFLGLLALVVWFSDIPKTAKFCLIIIICCVSYFGDWMFMGVLWVLFFGIFRGNFKKQTIAYYVVALISIAYVVIPNIYAGKPIQQNFWQIGLLFPPLLLLLYNGTRGNTNPFNKWFFYIFYPLHLAVLAIISFII